MRAFGNRTLAKAARSSLPQWGWGSVPVLAEAARYRTVGRMFLALVALAAWSSAGCERKDAAKTELPTPMVTVAAPVDREVVQYESFTGRTEAPEQVEVRARVSGYLIKIYFQPGTEVAKDAPLFEIDPEPFKADLAQSEAALARADAIRIRTAAEFNRVKILRARGASSVEELEKALGDKQEAAATVKADQAKISRDTLNLGYCSIKSPIAGRVGDKLVTEGNLVTGGVGNTTLLTTIVSVDPMFVAFDLDENTLQRVQRAVRAGQIVLEKAGAIPAEMGLALHGTGYPLKGALNFLNNQVDTKTGTIRVKAEFRNPKPEAGPRVLTPGMFARVRVPIGLSKRALLIPEVAILSDQGSRHIYVVGDGNKAARLDIEPGVLRDGYRVVESVKAPSDEKPRALRPDERVIVSGVQRVRVGLTVDPKAQSKAPKP